MLDDQTNAVILPLYEGKNRKSKWQGDNFIKYVWQDVSQNSD